eukprot:317016-Pyramimonas_sp.AAC.1
MGDAKVDAEPSLTDFLDQDPIAPPGVPALRSALMLRTAGDNKDATRDQMNDEAFQGITATCDPTRSIRASWGLQNRSDNIAPCLVARATP